MTKEDIYNLAEHLPGMGLMPVNNHTWRQAFKEYNDYLLSIGGYKLSMGCQPCYKKVFLFHLKQFLYE